MPYWSLYFGMEDEAILVLGARRILAGELPYYQWDIRHTPGAYLIAAGYFALVGVHQWAIRSLMGLVAAASGVVLYCLARRVFGPHRAYLPWALWCCGALTNFPILSYHWIGTLWALLAMYWILRWREGEPAALPPLAAFWSLALWCFQADGLAVALMVGLCWLRFRLPGLPRLLAYSAGCSLLLWLPFLPVAGEVWRENVGALVKYLPFNYYAYRWQPWLDTGRAALNPEMPPLARWAVASHFFLQSLTYGLYYVLIGLSLLAFELRRQPKLVPLAYCALGWALASGSRQTVGYLSFSCAPVFLCLTGLLSGLPRAPLWLWVVGALEVVGSLGRVLFLNASWTYPIATRAGVYYTASPAEAEVFGHLRRWSDRYFPPGSTVLAYPYLCSLYTTEGLVNPLRQPVLMPVLYSPEEVMQAQKVLQQKRVPYIVALPQSAEGIFQSYGIPVELFRSRSEEDLNIVTRGYDLVERQGGLFLYRLNDQGIKR